MNGENRIKRAYVVKAMETMVRCINYEDIIESWLSLGVADEDVKIETSLEEIADMSYCDDDNFQELMTLFLKLMNKAGNNGGLFCDGIVSGSKHVEWR